MKRLFYALTVIIFFVPAVMFAQDVKVLSWNDFLSGTKFAETETGKWDFVHAGRPLHEYTVVNVPAGIFSIRNMFRIGEDFNGGSFYLVVLNSQASFKFDGHETSMRMMFACKVENYAVCRDALAERLRRDIRVQSLGVSDEEQYTDGKLPEILKFAFLMLEMPQAKF